jgi:hypothetical protein
LSSSTIFDDVANRPLLPRVLALAAEQEVPLARLREIAVGSATATDAERLGDKWTISLIDLLERGNVGTLVRRDNGSVTFRFVDDVPSAEAAWARAMATE